MDIPRFVKWAGGKQQLIEQFKPLFPKEIHRYFEPFVGSGAVAFYVIQEFSPEFVLLSDINQELINAFEVIKNEPEPLIKALKAHKTSHLSDSKAYYYGIRGKDPNKMAKIEKAARFIYLNKTCFNGLYRVNSSGKFNVPMGSYKNPDIAQEQKLIKISELLKNVSFKAMSFEKVLELAKKGDFVYLDPPYYPLENSKSFTTYSKEAFLEKEQKLLAQVFKELAQRGCQLMLSNSDTKFIRELYRGFNIHVVKARRLINSDAKGRGEIKELVIRNY